MPSITLKKLRNNFMSTTKNGTKSLLLSATTRSKLKKKDYQFRLLLSCSDAPLHEYLFPPTKKPFQFTPTPTLSPSVFHEYMKSTFPTKMNALNFGW